MKIISHPSSHPPITEKDFSVAFFLVYKKINVFINSIFFNEQINKAMIVYAISDVYAELKTQEARLHFFLSLLYNTKVEKGGKQYTFVSTQSLTHFSAFELCELAASAVDAARHHDGFLQFISGLNKNTYASFEAILQRVAAEAPHSTFQEILLSLGFKKDDKKN